MEDKISLQVDNIGISFGGVQALSDISLDVRGSEILGLIGPNGAGKTVLLNCINGVYAPHKGIITFHSEEISGLARYKIAPLGIARCFQQIELFSQMNVIENTLVGTHFRTKTNIFSGGFSREISYRSVTLLTSESWKRIENKYPITRASSQTVSEKRR